MADDVKHDYHLVNPSPWPLIGSIALTTLAIGGVTYMVAASGGAPIRQVRPNTFTAAFRTELHYVIFDLDHGKLVGRAVNLAGEVFDTFVLPPNPPQSEP